MRRLSRLTGPWIFIGMAVLSVTTQAQGQDTAERRVSLKGIKAVSVVVAPLDAELERDGLTATQVLTDVEQRLRTAGINIGPSSGVLYISVPTATSNDGLYAYSIRVEFLQPVTLTREPHISILDVTTWDVGSIGLISESRLGSLRNRVTDYVDKFINAYLEQNPKR